MNLEQLKYFKEKNGYTFAQLAELSGVPQGTIQKIFNGETRTPRNKTVRALEFVMKSEQQNPTPDVETDFEDEPLGYTYGREFGSSDLVCEPSTVYKAKPGGYTLDDYYAIPDNRRVELIDGVIYDMAAPSTIHQYIAALYFRPRLMFRSTVMIARWWSRILLSSVIRRNVSQDVSWVLRIW